MDNHASDPYYRNILDIDITEIRKAIADEFVNSDINNNKMFMSLPHHIFNDFMRLINYHDHLAEDECNPIDFECVQADINNLYYDIRMLCYKSINDKPMIVNIVMTKYENCIVFILDTNTVRHFFEITMRQRETLTKSAKNK